MRHQTTNEQKVHLYKIAAAMADEGLDDRFICSAVKLAEVYEGAYGLMAIWQEESDPEEKGEALADVQQFIDEEAERPSGIIKKPKLPFDKLDEVGTQIMAFKKGLRNKVDRWGGISRLAKVTGIAQPSLSRFFSTASVPRRTTLYQIAEALDLPEDEVVLDWVAHPSAVILTGFYL